MVLETGESGLRKGVVSQQGKSGMKEVFKVKGVGVTESLGSLISPRNVKHTGLALQSKRCIICFLPRRLFNSLVPFALICVVETTPDPPLDPYGEPVFSGNL